MRVDSSHFSIASEAVDSEKPEVPNRPAENQSVKEKTGAAYALGSHVLGQYSRPAEALPDGDARVGLRALAAVAAFELCDRLDLQIPVMVLDFWRSRSLRKSGFDVQPAVHQPMFKAGWPANTDACWRKCPANQTGALIDISDEIPENGALKVQLADHATTIEIGSAKILIHCQLGNGIASAVVIADARDFAAPACNAIAEIYLEILCAMMGDENICASQAAGIGTASLQYALNNLSGHSHEYGAFLSIPDWLEQSAQRHGDRTAYLFGNSALSYRGFNGKANALAGMLAARGAGPETPVPVLLGNSLELPVCYFALMKLGAAFVPLDPGWPMERRQQALQALNSPLVLCTDLSAVPAGHRDRALAVDVALLDGGSAARIQAPIAPEQAIYGIFTSGTTGRPKCAMNNHAGLTNRFQFMTRYFHRNGGIRCVLQNTRHTFDSSVWQLFWPLTAGGTTVIPQEGAHLDLEGTVETIARHGVDMTDFVPSVFNQLVVLAEHSHEVRHRLATLRELVVGGEEITPQMVHRLRAILPALRITNAYGPTETSIGMVFHPVEDADGLSIPLGRPIDNCHVVVVDAALRPLPPGARGELLVGGVCVGNGYLDDAERTAAAFVDNPFASIAGAKLYRTGDLGYFDSLGRLRFSGRRDFQVKVGGVRIELGEIESAAELCPGVNHAKAMTVGQGDDRALALFAAGDSRLTRDALEAHLRGALPRHTVPRHIVVLAEMPTTDNGKLDRRALLQHLERPALDTPADEPPPHDAATPLGDAVLAVFRRQLQQPSLSADDAFFDHGGDSLQAVSLIVSLEKRFGVPVRIAELMAQPTARQIAGCIAAKQRSAATGHAHSRDGSGKSETPDDEQAMERDAMLPPGWVASHRSDHTVARVPSSIFMTGATGFVGSHLAYEILSSDPSATVYALCRQVGQIGQAGQAESTQWALVAGLQQRGLWRPDFQGRLVAVPGDLAQPAFGLDAAAWGQLSQSCDAVLHCGAMVNFLYDYGAHRLTNVLGTQEALRMALEGRAKPLHHISTLGTLDRHAALQTTPLAEDFDLAQGIRPASGYSRSKWAAERLLDAARMQGAMVSIYRLGEVMPAAAEGLPQRPNERALTHFLLAAIAHLGVRPSAEMVSDWTPADYVARRVALAMRSPQAWGRTFHVLHPQRVAFQNFFDVAGIPTPPVSCTAWINRLDAAVAAGGLRALTVVRSLLPATGDEEAFARSLSGLLTDNPRLFRRDQCTALERTLAEEDDSAVAASAGRYAWQLLGFCADAEVPQG